MRKRIRQRKLNRTSEHRKALLRNLAQSMVEHGQITTTLPKAKALKPYFEKIVTLAVKVRRLASEDDRPGSLRARRRLHQLLGDRAIISEAHREAYGAMSDARRQKTLRMASGRRYRTGEPKGRLDFTAESVTHRLLFTVAPRFEDRPGGYTRLIRLPRRRLGDAAPTALLQLVGGEEVPSSLTKAGKSGRRRRIESRYDFAIRASKSWAGSGKKDSPKTEAPSVTPDDSSETDQASD